MNCIKMFKNAKALEISVGNIYSKYQLMYTVLENFQKGGKCSAQIASHQAESRGEEIVLIKNHYIYLPCKLIN